MAVDYFLKFDSSANIKGESSDDKHKDEIQVMSWSLGATNQASIGHGTGAGAGKVSVSDVSILKKFDTASVNLFVACATGKHIPSAVLTARKAGGEQSDFITITMSDVLISSFQNSASDEVPSETVSIAYSKIKFEYSSQAKTGAVTPAGTGGWDVLANIKV